MFAKGIRCLKVCYVVLSSPAEGPSPPADGVEFSGGRLLHGADFSRADFSAGPTSPNTGWGTGCKSDFALQVMSLWKWAHFSVRRFYHWLFSKLQCLWLVNPEFCGQSQFELTFPNQSYIVKSEPLDETVQQTLKSEFANSWWRETWKVSLLSKFDERVPWPE